MAATKASELNTFQDKESLHELIDLANVDARPAPTISENSAFNYFIPIGIEALGGASRGVKLIIYRSI
jgi:hypothetical protein